MSTPTPTGLGLRRPLNNLLSQRVNLAGVFLLLLLSADMVFVLVHLVHTFSPFLSDQLFSVQQDRGCTAPGFLDTH